MSDVIVTEKRTLLQRFKDPGNKNLLLFAGGTVVVVLLYSTMFASAPPPPPQSQLSQAPPHASSNGTAVDVPREYLNSVNIDDQRRIEEAKKNGTSVTRTLVTNNPAGGLPATITGFDEMAPTRPSANANPAFQNVPLAPAAPAPARQQAQTQQLAAVDTALMQKMIERLGKLEGTAPAPAEIVHFTDRSTQGNGAGANTMSAANAGRGGYNNQGMDAGRMQQASVTQQQAPMGQQARRSRFRVPAPGTILYSEVKSRVNSDTPGPVLGEIQQGPFAGARLLGTFAFSERGVVITFNTMSVPYRDDNGEEQVEVMPIRAVAVDSANLGTAMATDIDRHLLERIAVAAGTSFMQGLGQAVAQSGATAVVSPYGTTVTNPLLSGSHQMLMAGGAAAGAVGQIAQQYYGNRRTTVTVDASTPFGLLFLSNNGTN